MNHQLAKIAGPTIITFALFLGGAAVHSQSGSPGRMLFTVWPGQTGKQPDSPILDPVALVTASGFDEPLKYGSAEGKEAEAIYDTFEKAYLNSGQKYPLLFGGSEIGGGRRRGSGRNKLRIINCDRKTIGSASQRSESARGYLNPRASITHELASAQYNRTALRIPQCCSRVPDEKRSYWSLAFCD